MSRVEAALLSPLDKRLALPTTQKGAVCLEFRPRDEARREAGEDRREARGERREEIPVAGKTTAPISKRVQIRPGIKASDHRALKTTNTVFAPVARESSPKAGVEGRAKPPATPAAARASSWKPSALVQPAERRPEASGERREEPARQRSRDEILRGAEPKSASVASGTSREEAVKPAPPPAAPLPPPASRLSPTPEPAPGPVTTAGAPAQEGTLPGLSWSAVPGRGRVPTCIGAPDSPVATEQYRKLAGALLRAQEAHAIKIVMTASALPSEGKSLTTAALAYTLSNSYRRNVLVIDADMRLSSMHDVFGVPNGPGLSDFLEARQRGSVVPVEVMPGLTLLTAGRATTDPVGGLTSPRMRQLLAEASKRFDWVIIDTPPVTLLPDANLMTAMVDGVVLVIAAGETQYPFLTRAVAALGRDRILGTVLNRAKNGAHLKSYAYSKGY